MWQTFKNRFFIGLVSCTTTVPGVVFEQGKSIGNFSMKRIPKSVVEIKEGQLKKWAMMHNKKGNEVPGVIIRESAKTTVRK